MQSGSRDARGFGRCFRSFGFESQEPCSVFTSRRARTVEDPGLIDAALFVHSVITYDRIPRFMVLNAKAGGML
jgi:hypothetical protein